MNMYLCKYTDETLSKRFGIINLPQSKALELESQGKVKIINKNNTTMKVISEYNNKVNDNILKKFDNKKKIAWVQDLSKTGGAEISNEYLIKIGRSLGYTIKQITPSDFDFVFLLASDLIIINNFYEFSIDQYKKIYKLIYEMKRPYIKYDHDHREITRLQISRQLFDESLFNVFISPAHETKFKKYFHNEFIILPLAIDTSVYVNKNINRNKNSILAPSLRKCQHNLLNYIKENPDKKYTVILDNAVFTNNFKKENIDVLTKVNKSSMADLYNAHETVYHCPDTFWAGERVLFEARLCGCKLISNDNAGHSSWIFKDDEEMKLKLEQAPFTFWKAIDNVFKT